MRAGFAAAHRLRRFNDAEADFLDRAFDHARHIGGGGDDEHHDDSAVAEAGADDELCDRQHCDHEDDERDAAEDVYEHAHERVEPADGMDAVARGDAQQHAQRQPQQVRNARGDERHVDRLPHAELDQPLVPELIEEV